MKEGVEVMLEKEVVLIDDISSISESFFSLKYKKQIIDVPPLTCKVKVNPEQDSRYHFDADDLKKMGKLESTVFPFSGQNHLSKNEYINYLKEQLTILIIDGKFLPLLEHAYNRSFKLYEFRWRGK